MKPLLPFTQCCSLSLPASVSGSGIWSRPPWPPDQLQHFVNKHGYCYGQMRRGLAVTTRLRSCFYYPASTPLCISFYHYSLSFPPSRLHLGSEIDDTVVTITSIKSLTKVHITNNDSYLPKYMLSTTLFTIGGLRVRSETGNCTNSSTITGSGILNNIAVQPLQRPLRPLR